MKYVQEPSLEDKGGHGRLCRESNSKTEPHEDNELATQMEGEMGEESTPGAWGWKGMSQGRN